MGARAGIVLGRNERNAAMGFMDSLKGMMGKGKDLAAENEDAILDGIDKAADMADEKTDGKYTDQIETGAEKAKEVVEGLDGEDN